MPTLTTEDVRFLIDKNDKLKTTRLLYEPLWEEIAQYIFPRRIGIGWQPTQGQKQTSVLYDSTAIHSNELLAASMHGTLTPSSSRWFSLKLRDETLNRVKEIMDWLDVCSDRMYLALRQSNFNSEIHEVFLDQGSFGTACLLIEEKPIKAFGFQGLQFQSLQNSGYCIAEDAEGRVDTLIREFELSARAAVKKWGPDNLGKKVKEAIDNKKEEDKFKFLHCVYPSEKNGQPFISYYIGVEEQNEISTQKYYEFPFMVPRWSKSSGETYGRGPGHTALPDVKTLNKAKEFGLKAWAKDLDPPTFERDGGVVGSLKLYPGGRNVARDKESIWTMDHKIRYDVSQIKEEELRQSIRQIFYSDQLKLQEGPEMTATEVQVRYELMQRLLGPTIGRLESELMNPLIERVFGVMFRANSKNFQVLPAPPPILAKMGIKEIDIEYEGPLAKAQRMSELSANKQVWSVAVDMSTVQPEVLDNLNGDSTIRNTAEIVGATKILNSIEEVARIRADRAKAQAAEQQKQDMERMAMGAGKAAPALKALSEAAGGQGGGQQGAGGQA